MPLPPRRPAPSVDRTSCPTVDVFIPTYNEERDLLADHAGRGQGDGLPGRQVHGLAARRRRHRPEAQLRQAGEAAAAQQRHAELQAALRGPRRHLPDARARNQHAKAGNLNNGLAHSTGDLVAVFDADHAPARDFLKETVGYFAEDPKLFLVQTPHFFLNPDPLERNLDTFEKMPSENEMFYGIIQRGLDKWNAVVLLRLGRRAAARGARGDRRLLRRSASPRTARPRSTLHARGWNSVYVDKPLIAGLQPETFASFIGQRSRWAQGMMQILRFQFPLFKRGLIAAAAALLPVVARCSGCSRSRGRSS